MEEWVERALKRWPNVPALFGWLTLTRRGRWLLKGEVIHRPQIIDAINHNYASDEHGRWFFQNGPQRGYMQLEYAPLVLHTTDRGRTWCTHTQLPVQDARSAYIDEEGTVVVVTEHGPGLVSDDDLEWVLQKLTVAGKPIDESHIAKTLALPTGMQSSLSIAIADRALPVVRLDAAQMPTQLHFVRDPQPLNQERVECLPSEKDAAQ